MKTRLFLLFGLLALPALGGAQEILFGLDAAQSRILQIDPDDGSIVHSFATPVLCRPEGPCGLAYSGISLYFADATDPEQRIYELNPLDGTIWNSIPAPTNSVDGLAFSGGQLYAMSFLDDRIYRLNPPDGEVLEIFEPGRDLIGGFGAGDGRIFASRIRPALLFELDPEDGSVINELEPPLELPTGLALLDGRLFATDFESGLLVSLDPDSGELLASFDMGSAELAALASGAPQTVEPYELTIEVLEEGLSDENAVVIQFRVRIQDRLGRILTTNDHSPITFDVDGPGSFIEGNVQTVSTGSLVAAFEGEPGSDLVIVARLSGADPATIAVSVVAPAAIIDLTLEQSADDSTIVEAVAELFDAAGELAVKDVSEVTFRVVGGAGVLTGPSVVVPVQAVARTRLILEQQNTDLAVNATVREAERTARLEARTPVTLAVPPGGLTVSAQSAAGRDNIPPEPPSDLLAQLENGEAVVTWDLSAGDGQVRWFVFEGRAVRRTAVSGYSLYRSLNGGEFELLAALKSGVSAYIDTQLSEDGTYRYKVLSRDRDNLAELSIQPGTAADRRRTIVIGEPELPRDAEGQPVRGLFNAAAVVDFDDFFIFTDNFGTTLRDGAFDPLFDLDGNGRVDFDDLFIFADSFGREAVPP